MHHNLSCMTLLELHLALIIGNTYSRDRINVQFPTSHYNSIKANLLLPLEHCFGWMLSGGPTPLWAQLRTFKHIKISQALHCPDYCLNIICFYILSLPLWLIFPSKIIPISDDFSLLWRGFRVGWVSLPFMQRYLSPKWAVNSVFSYFLTHLLSLSCCQYLTAQDKSTGMHKTWHHLTSTLSLAL